MADFLPFTGHLPYSPYAPAPVESPAGVPAAPLTARAQPEIVLFCWELGGGLGHLMQMLPLAQELVKAGHRVFVALRDLDRAGAIYASAGVWFLQAPIWLSGAALFPRPVTYAQVLGNCGFGSNAALFARACAWRNLIKMVAPDLVIFDHAPTALLASRGLPKVPLRALIGSGFCCPPDDADGDTPWAVVRPEEVAAADLERLREDDAQVLARCNWVLAKWGQPPLDGLGQLYSEVDENFLTTFPELDHFPQRSSTGGRAARGTRYWGPVITQCPGGEPPQWPDRPGPRVLVYLKNPLAAEAAVAALTDAKASTVAFIDGAAADLRQKLESAAIHLASRPLDLRRAAAECDLAVLGGGHGATVEMLLAGKPVLELPAAREQRMIADAVARLGAGEVAQPKRPEEVGHKLTLMLGSDRYRNAAQAFARRYRAFDPRRQRAAMLSPCEALLTSAACRGRAMFA